MDLEYMGRLMLSFAIFAPGLILVAFLAVLGLIMLGEKLVRGTSRQLSPQVRQTASGQSATNPAPGGIVSALTEELAGETAQVEVALAGGAKNVVSLSDRG